MRGRQGFSSTFNWLGTICLLFGKWQRQLVGAGLSLRSVCSLLLKAGSRKGRRLQSNAIGLGTGSGRDV